MSAARQLFGQAGEVLGRLTGLMAGRYRRIADGASGGLGEVVRRAEDAGVHSVAGLRSPGVERHQGSLAGSGRPGTADDARSAAKADSGFDPDSPVSVRNLPPSSQLEFYWLSAGNGENYTVWHQGKEIGIYKPRTSARKIRNEVTAWEAGRILGVGNVPYTRAWVGHKGQGTLQEHVPNQGPRFGFETEEGKGIAAFDYIMASGDAHNADALARVGGGIARVDNEDVIPDRMTNDANFIRSTYVADNLNEPLPANVVERLNEVDPAEFSEFLRSRGHSHSSSEWAADRLVEAQGGVISGDRWGCAIVNENYQVSYPSGYGDVREYWADHPPVDEEIEKLDD